ncbi:alpha/beta fold hydrolase [Chloroflexota bacterium]
MDEYFETSDRVKLKTTVWKSGKQTLLFLHGWGGNQVSFTSTIEALKGDYTILSFDQRGFGESEKPDTTYSFERLAQDIHEVIEKQNLKDVVLVGWSMGGVAAAIYLDIYGKDRIAKLVLLDVNIRMMGDENYPYGFYNGVCPEKELLRDLSLIARDFRLFAQELPERCDMRLFSPEQRAGFVERVVQQNQKKYPLIAMWLATADVDLSDIYKRLDLPVLFCHGGMSTFCPPKACDHVMGLLPRATLVEFPECSHFIPIERPGQLAEAIDKFTIS